MNVDADGGGGVAVVVEFFDGFLEPGLGEGVGDGWGGFDVDGDGDAGGVVVGGVHVSCG